MAERKDRMALLSRYSKLYIIKHEMKPLLNLNVEQWSADALIESYGLPMCYDLLEYYFDVAQTPTWKYFANYADNIISAKEMHKNDQNDRAIRREQARKWLSE
jgi:hypothetical protein